MNRNDIYDSRLTDEELLQIIRDKTEELGRLPMKSDIPEFPLIKGRFGPWPRALEAAGVKEVSDRYIRHKNRKKAWKDKKRARKGGQNK